MSSPISVTLLQSSDQLIVESFNTDPAPIGSANFASAGVLSSFLRSPVGLSAIVEVRLSPYINHVTEEVTLASDRG